MKTQTKLKKHCHFCQTLTLKPPLDNWIEENHYQGKHGQILKEVFIGVKSENTQASINTTVYYCSIRCLEAQFDKEEAEDWAKGKCVSCGIDLVVINEQCHDNQHQQEAKYLAIPTPECLKKN